MREIRVAILTVSDSVIAGTRENRSGPTLADLCRDWTVVEHRVLPDEAEQISSYLAEVADQGRADLILTTGGTGLAPRDITPEATKQIIERDVPGIPELIREQGRKDTKFTAISRGVAGIRKNTLIINLPGSLRGTMLSFQIVQDLMPHAIDLLNGETKHE